MALRGISVVEIAGLAPAPFAGMVLADFGAKVIRVDRFGKFKMSDGLSRGKRSIAIELKNSLGVEALKRICRKSDVLIEPFRPGVMEKLGLGPDILMKQNPKLVYARLSGFGQTGPYKHMAGHDINYIATSGILSAISRDGGKPHPPLNLAADFAGGGLTCAFGILAALLEREKSGLGQVVDVSMTAGAAYLGTFVYSLRSQIFPNPVGQNLLDTGAPFYDTCRTKDGRYVAVGALEPQFFRALIKGLKLDIDNIPPQMETERWPELRNIIEEKIGEYTMEELAAIFDGSDACVLPVLNLDEAPHHPHNKANDSFHTSDDGLLVPSPAPKLSRTPGTPSGKMNVDAGEHTREILSEYGFSDEEIQRLENDNIVNKSSYASKL